MSVVTRFAPSPTGHLHLGSARTALFNWLYARHYGGQFLLRIEDTDAERSQTMFESSILDTLKWMGLTWDQDVIYQSARADRHRQVAFDLVNAGLAYRCYMTDDERHAMRTMPPEEALKQSRIWRDKKPPQPDQPFAVRLKVPLGQYSTIRDGVQGKVTVSTDTFDDIVLLRQDGTPTYMLAVVVDDHDMNVTHIIRGDDHLTNAFRQKEIYQAMQWAVPVFCHIPLIHSATGQKLSKRNNDMNVMDYQAMGIVPAALVNALVRLGWSHGNEEKITIDQAIQWFDGTCLSKSAARFDEKKLLFLNSYYMRTMPENALWDAVHTVPDAMAPCNAHHMDKARRIMVPLAQRCQTLRELGQAMCRYTHADIKMDSALNDDDKNYVNGCMSVLTDISPWDGVSIETALRTHCHDQGIAFKDVAAPLRTCLTGASVSPNLTDVMMALGKEWTLYRIQQAVSG